MLAFAPWTGLSWSTEFSRSWRESPTRTRICSCRYSTRSTRQTVSERGASFDRAMVKCLKCDCICARCRHNSNVGESRENSDVLFTNAFDKIPRHNQSTVEAVPDVPRRLLRGRRREDADGVSGNRVGSLRGLATQQTTASARSFHRIPLMSTASRSFHCTPNDSPAALLLNLVVAEKVSRWSSPHRRDSEVQDEWWELVNFGNSPIALITVAEKCIAVCNWIILNWSFFVLRRRKSWWTVRCLLQLPGGSRAERRDSDLLEERSGLSLAKGHHATNHSHRTGWVLNWVGVVNFAWFVALRGIRELLEIKFKPEARSSRHNMQTAPIYRRIWNRICILMASSIRSTGTGTAPFRSFWQELDEIKWTNDAFNVPKVWLFFGCRAKSLDLYSEEKRAMLEKGILDKVFLALSREVNTPKVSRLCSRQHRRQSFSFVFPPFRPTFKIW